MAISSIDLSPEQAQALVREHPPVPVIYWSDLLLSSASAWALFALSLTVPRWSVSYWITTLVSIVVFLRAGYFMHELAHRRPPELPGFEWTWNLLIGIPILLPSFMIWPHIDHHRPATYGTAQDPEYAPIAGWSRWRILASLLGFGLIPLYLPLRFGLLGPLSLAVPPVRAKAWSQFSTVDINSAYRRRPLDPERSGTVLAQEMLCTAFVWGALIATGLGLLPIFVHVQRLIVMCGSLVLNHSRTLVVHRYSFNDQSAGLNEQVLDTVTLEGSWWLSGLLAPLGSQYHALHHTLPTLPYHALRAVHRKVVATLPEGTIYDQTRIQGILRAWSAAWQRTAGRGPWH